MQKRFLTIIICGFALNFALSGLGMENTLTFRPFTKDDRQNSLAMGLQYYMDRYSAASYFIVDYTDENKYKLLEPKDNSEKSINLISDANKLLDAYLINNNKGLHAWVVEKGGKCIGGLFYRVKNNGVLVIDEIIITSAESDEIKTFILTNYLRKKEPQCHTHKYFLREINTEDLRFFSGLGFERQNEEETNAYYDSKLYLGLTKTYQSN